MPGKSQHRKRGHLSQRQIEKARQRSLPATQQQIANQTPKPAAVTKLSISAPSTNPTINQNVYVIAELKRIGILTGIILVILIVLFLVLPKP